MTPSARIQATIELLEAIATTPRPADALTSAYFRARRYIGSKDRAAISSMLYDILRHHARLGWWLARFAAEETPRNYAVAYMILVEKRKAREVATLFDGQKFSPSALTVQEGDIAHHLDGEVIEPDDMPEVVRAECPAWAEGRARAQFGKNFVAELRAMLAPAPLDLRVNQLKAERGDMLVALRDLGLKVAECRYAPLGLRVMERPNLSALPMLKNGEVEIQDEGSQLVALLVDAKPGMRVVDFCAGAGGKTLAIAAMMQNKGRVVATDVLAGRLKRSTERFRKAGLHNIEVKALSTERDPWVKRHKESFDRVLVDAPCSGTGTWRRNPDARWCELGPGIDTLLPLQASILESASRLVKKGGRLVYATCSILPDENERQIEKFITTHPDFHVVNFHEIMTKNAPCQGPYLTLTPRQHDTDGFFAAVLERKI